LNNPEDTTVVTENGNGRRRWHFFLILMGAVILLSETFGLSAWLFFLRNLIQHEGFAGNVLFVIIYAATSLALIPGTGLTILAGSLFPPFVAIILSSTGALIAAVLAFWIARRFARDRVEKWFMGHEKYEKYSSYIATHGIKILIFLRLIPIFPHVALNYVFGLARISFVSYVFWTWLCLLPGTTIYVLIANRISSDLFTGHIFFAMLFSLVLISVLIYLAW
jgi:uncharacterized membrane protein YdjX (TVP38/TMEM64 family)